MPHATSDDYKFNMAFLQRDPIGYGRNPPMIQWPNGAKIAVNFVLNYEEGGERSVEDGDAQPEDNLHEFKGLSVVPGARDMSVESQFDYGSRVAIWRILDLFEENNIPITFYTVARAFERNPLVAKAAEDGGHEVASHCFKWQPHAFMEPQKEEMWIRKAIDSFKQTSPSGKVPVGWYYGRPSMNTAPLLTKIYKELGHELLYFADNYADDLPFWTVRPGAEDKEGLLLMPYALDTNDFKIWHGQFGSDDSFAQRCIDAVKTLFDEAAAGKRTGYVTIALHGRWIGRPGRFQALKRIVEELKGKYGDDVWFATREQIARHFAAEMPYESVKKSVEARCGI
ncbi:hypothetical protein JCM10207_007579 [Rhodosporidiobolus poonsookiae]